MKTIAIIFTVLMVLVILSPFHRSRKKKRVEQELPNLLSAEEWTSGRDLRLKLKDRGINILGVTFYSIMREFADEGRVIELTTEEMLDNEQLKVRKYKLNRYFHPND